MLTNKEKRDFYKLLLDDPAGKIYPDVCIDVIINTFTIPESLVVVLILNGMKIDFDKVKKFIEAMKC